MLLFPFLFFLLLLIAIYRKNGFDVSANMVSLFLITSFFAIILGNTDHQYSYENYSLINISVVPTILYCALIGICIIPYIKYNSNKKRDLVIIKNVRLFDYISVVYIIDVFVLLAIFWKNIVFILAFGDFGELRNMVYNGYFQDAIQGYSGPIRFIATIFTILGEGGYFMILFFFYSICALNKKTWQNLAILFGSLSPIIMGFVNIDRSKVVFWILLFILCFFIFRPFIYTKRQKKEIKKIIIVFGGLLLLYLASVTISRWGDSDTGTSGGLLVYIGQPFINFCNIWDNLWKDDVIIQRVMPVTSYFVGGESVSVDYVDFIYSRYGVHINVFTSFVGVFLIDLGHLGAIFLPAVIFLITQMLLKKPTSSKVITIRTAIIIMGLGTIIQCGIIAYYYETIGRMVTLFMFVYIARFFGNAGVIAAREG